MNQDNESPKKKIAALIVAKAAGRSSTINDDGPTQESHDVGDSTPEERVEGHVQAAREIADAIKSGDHEGMATSLKNFMEMCK